MKTIEVVGHIPGSNLTNLRMTLEGTGAASVEVVQALKKWNRAVSALKIKTEAFPKVYYPVKFNEDPWRGQGKRRSRKSR